MDFLSNFGSVHIAISFGEFIFRGVISLMFGFIVSLSYILCNRKKQTSESFALTLVLMPIIVSALISFVGDDLKKAVAIIGAFSLIRFRSIPGDSKDIIYICFAMVVGLMVGIGEYFAGLIFSMFVSVVFVVLTLSGFGKKNGLNKTLKISVPEDLNFSDAFNDILDKWTLNWSLESMKTINMGSLYQLTYSIKLKDANIEKQFMDELRTRNGNLPVLICKSAGGETVSL